MVVIWWAAQSRPARAFSRLSRQDQSFVVAVATALTLRLVWVILATRTPMSPLGDATEYLRMAEDFSRGRLPTFVNGEPTAFYAAGLSMLLAPFAWVARVTGWFSLAFAASLVNVVAGTVTVALTGVLAGRWIHPRTRAISAWIMAVAPAHIYLTSTAHGETVFLAIVLGCLTAITVLVDRRSPAQVPLRSWVVVGLLAAVAMLVRAPGLVILLMPLLVIRGRTGSWRGAGRPTLALLGGAAVLLVPWAITNGVHVGVWSPFSTQNATALCVGNHQLSNGGFPRGELPPEISEDCYVHSPFDDPELGLAPPGWTHHGVDEARWYREASAHGLGFALTHPDRELWLARQKMVRMWGTEWDALPLARNYEEIHWAGRAEGTLDTVANLWLWAVEILAVGSLLFVRASRRAVPIWGLAALFTLVVIGGVAQPHFRHPVIPFLVILASGALHALGQRLRPQPVSSGRSSSSASDEEAADDVEPGVSRRRDPEPV